MKTLYSKPYFPLFNQSSYFFVDWFKIIVSSREILFYCFFFLTFGIHCDGIKLIILPSSVNHRFSCALSWQNQIWITFFGWKTNLTISSKMLFIRRDFVGQTIFRAQHWFYSMNGCFICRDFSRKVQIKMIIFDQFLIRFWWSYLWNSLMSWYHNFTG